MLVFHWEHRPQISFFCHKAPYILILTLISDQLPVPAQVGGVCEIWVCVSEEQIAASIFQQIKSFCLFLLCCHQRSAAVLNKDVRAEKFLHAAGRMGNLSFLRTHRLREGWGPMNRQNWAIGACHWGPKLYIPFTHIHTRTRTHTQTQTQTQTHTHSCLMWQVH